MRTRAEKYRLSKQAQTRKKQRMLSFISKDGLPDTVLNSTNYWNKNNILNHCSCLCCSSKTKICGLSAHDKKHEERMNYEEI